MIAGMVREPLAHPQWQALRAFLSASVAQSDDTAMEEVERALRGPEAQLWAVFDRGRPILAAVTQLHVVGDRKEAFCWQMGGDFTRAGDALIAVFLPWAKNEGCAVAEISGRLGWMRKLRDWKAVSVTMRKELA